MAGCICIDYKAVERFFRSCALTIEMQLSIEINWVEYKDSAFLNAVYTVYFWKEGPGSVEINISSARELEDKVEKRTDKYVQTFFQKLHEKGFAEAAQYAEAMNNLKLSSRQAINDAFSSVREINAEIIGETEKAIKRAATVKLAAGVGVAVLSGGAGVLAVSGATAVGGVAVGASPLVFTGVSVANSMTHSVIKSWHGGRGAKAVAVDFSKEAGKEVVSETANMVGGKYVADAAAKSIVQKNAKLTVNRYSQILGRKSTTLNNVAKRTRQLSQSQSSLSVANVNAAKAVTKASAARGFQYSLPVVFAAFDIMNEVQDYRDTIQGLR